jgi:hypothetical protein
METVRQVINEEGLQIPLPLVERYGLQPGARVILELDSQGIRIVPALPNANDVENIALRYLLIHLGDAVQVKVEQENDEWQVAIFGEGLPEPFGTLVYSQQGTLISEKSSSTKALREAALAAYSP